MANEMILMKDSRISNYKSKSWGQWARRLFCWGLLLVAGSCLAGNANVGNGVSATYDYGSVTNGQVLSEATTTVLQDGNWRPGGWILDHWCDTWGGYEHNCVVIPTFFGNPHFLDMSSTPLGGGGIAGNFVPPDNDPACPLGLRLRATSGSILSGSGSMFYGTDVFRVAGGRSAFSVRKDADAHVKAAGYQLTAELYMRAPPPEGGAVCDMSSYAASYQLGFVVAASDDRAKNAGVQSINGSDWGYITDSADCYYCQRASTSSYVTYSGPSTITFLPVKPNCSTNMPTSVPLGATTVTPDASGTITKVNKPNLAQSTVTVTCTSDAGANSGKVNPRLTFSGSRSAGMGVYLLQTSQTGIMIWGATTGTNGCGMWGETNPDMSYGSVPFDGSTRWEPGWGDTGTGWAGHTWSKSATIRWGICADNNNGRTIEAGPFTATATWQLHLD